MAIHPITGCWAGPNDEQGQWMEGQPSMAELVSVLTREQRSVPIVHFKIMGPSSFLRKHCRK